MVEFNLALVTNSLMAHVFKARYFLSCSFLEAKLGSSPSYI